jgi:hypothetical protein
MQNVIMLLRRSGKEKREEGGGRREEGGGSDEWFYLKEAWAPFSSDHFRVAPPHLTFTSNAGAINQSMTPPSVPGSTINISTY